MNNRLRTLGVLLPACGLAGLGLALLACPQTEPDHRGELAQASGRALILPELERARERAAELDEAAAALCQEPTADTLDAAQGAWWALREPWKRLMAVPIGPIVDSGYASALDFWPARPANVEGGIEAGVTSQAGLDALGVASKGLPAVEYLLWDPVGGDAAILAALAAADTGPARCSYLRVLVDDVELQLEALAGETEGFVDELADAGTSERYPTLALATDELLNAAIAGLHDVNDAELDKPLGLEVGAAVQPELFESRFSDRSKADVRDALEGFRRFYLGADAGVDESPGFTILVEQASPEIDARVRDRLDAAITAVEALPEPLRTAMDVDPEACQAASDAVRELRAALTADVAALLGVTISLTDNDGD